VFAATTTTMPFVRRSTYDAHASLYACSAIFRLSKMLIPVGVSHDGHGVTVGVSG